MKLMTIKQADEIRIARGETATERLPWVKDSDLVHLCPGSGGHPISVTVGKQCPHCKETPA